MPQKTKTYPADAVRELKKDGTTYRISRVFTGEKKLSETLEKMAVRRIYEELSMRAGPH
jgi:hypothetical protein